jgi:hypothetical protein
LRSLFERDSKNQVIGFNSDGRKVFRGMAHELRSFHLSGFYCGDLRGRVRIDDNFNVSFAYRPVKAADRLQEQEGIKIDTLQFRFLVAQAMKREMSVESDYIPDQLKLFFSSIYKVTLESGTLDEVKDISLFQMLHPIFFNSRERKNFMYMVVQYASRNKDAFEEGLDLSPPDYELLDFTKHLNEQSPVYPFLNRSEEFKNSNRYFTDIPRNIRDAYEHLDSV